MKQKPPQQEEPSQEPQKRTKRKAVEEARDRLSVLHKQNVRERIQEQWTPKHIYGPGPIVKQRQPDGTIRQVTPFKKLGPHPPIDPDLVLEEERRR